MYWRKSWNRLRQRSVFVKTWIYYQFNLFRYSKYGVTTHGLQKVNYHLTLSSSIPRKLTPKYFYNLLFLYYIFRYNLQWYVSVLRHGEKSKGAQVPFMVKPSQK